MENKNITQEISHYRSGPIGIEMAQAFSLLGSEVTVLEANERILIKEDSEVSELISEVLSKEGIKLLTSHKVDSFEQNRVICKLHNKEVRIEFDLVLLAIGRRPLVLKALD